MEVQRQLLEELVEESLQRPQLAEVQVPQLVEELLE
jgi:hypothetical protein